MLNAITTRTSTPHEDAEPWPGGSARPVLDYLTGTLGMTGADARELLKAARTAQAEGGPGTLADYPVPGRDAHLLIHYAPGSRAYRFKLTAPGENDEAPPGTSPEPGAPGNQPGPDGPPGGRETPDGSPAGDPGRAPAPGRPALPGPAKITVTIWHNVAFDGQGRHVAMLDGYQPGDPVVRVFAYQADPAGRTAEEIADEAFDTFNDHPRDADGADLACAYYGRRLRSLSAGDVVAVGDVLLAVGRPAGWEPVTGPLTEVRTREHGTSPLPDPGRLPAACGPPRSPRPPPARSRAHERADGCRCGRPQSARDADRRRRSPVPRHPVLRLLAVRARLPRPARKQEPPADGDLPDARAGQAAAGARQRLRAVPAPQRRGLVGLRGRGRAADR